MKLLIAVCAIILLLVIFLSVWRIIDRKNTQSLWSDLILNAPTNTEHFDPDSIATLPEPAQRFLLYTIRPGTLLRSTVELEMSGEFSLGTKDQPNYLPMYARQILSPPYGFIWQVSMGKGITGIAGSDAAHPKGSWTRFWLSKLLPVARLGNNNDHRKSSFGRYMSEAIFWLPSSVLPSQNISWQEVNKDKARVTIMYEGMTLSVDITVNEIGQPTIVEFQRWSNANTEEIFRLQPFGATSQILRNLMAICYQQR